MQGVYHTATKFREEFHYDARTVPRDIHKLGLTTLSRTTEMSQTAFIALGIFAGSSKQRLVTQSTSARPAHRFNSSFVARRTLPFKQQVARRRPETRCAVEPLTLAELAWIPYAIGGTEVVLNVFNFAMVVRIILSWYPQTRLSEQPWIFVAVPTEPLLSAMRKIVKPIGGVDISPIVWFAIGSFLHEILVGQQGLLVLVKKYF